MFPEMMSPGFAVAGVAAIGLAVWMHLYQRTARRRIPVSSLRLVPETPQVARSRRRIQYWPLFLLRALGLLLLGAAFARPSLPQSDGGLERGREVVVFILDRSGSMGMRVGEGPSAWEEAVEQVQDRLSGLHPQSRVRLFCFPPVETTKVMDHGEDWLNPAALRKVVAGLAPSQAAGRPLDAVQDAVEAIARFRTDMPESLEIIGDLQQLGWDSIDTLTLPAELQVQVKQVGDPEAANRGLALQVRGHDQLRRGAVVTRGGNAPVVVRDWIVSNEGASDQGSSNQEDVESEPTVREFPLPDEVLELPYRASTNGWVRREIAFDQATDGLPNDDRLFDTFFVTPEIPVILLEPYPEREAFLQTTFFLQQALRPKTGQAAEDSRFLPRVVPIDEAVDALGELTNDEEKAREAVIVVPGLANWPEELPAVIESFLQQGGGVVFFAGPDLEPQGFGEAWRELLPALPSEVLSLDRSLSLPPISATHPIWGGLSPGTRRRLRKVPLRQRFALAVTADADTTARYVDDVPLVVVRQVGEGRSLFVNTSPDRAWGDWPADGALFVPTVHMLVSAVVTTTAQTLRNSPAAGIVGVPFDVQVAPQWSGTALHVEDLTLSADEQGWVRGLRFDRPGLFDILTQDGRYVRPVAVNFPPAESRRVFFHPTVLQRQLETRRRAAGSDADAARISMAAESGWWRWILVVLAAVWLVEPWQALRSAHAPINKGTAS